MANHTDLDIPVPAGIRGSSKRPQPEAATTFELYSKLPYELKTSIIREAILPQIVNVQAYSTWKNGLCGIISPPVVFQGLARGDVLTRDTLLETHEYKLHEFMYKSQPILINKKTDILKFDNFRILSRFLSPKNSATLLRPEEIGSIAVDYDVSTELFWEPVNEFNYDRDFLKAILNAIRCFGSLRKLYIVQDDHLGSKRPQERSVIIETFRSYTEECISLEKLQRDEEWYGLDVARNHDIGYCFRWRAPEVVVITKSDFEHQFMQGELDV